MQEAIQGRQSCDETLSFAFPINAKRKKTISEYNYRFRFNHTKLMWLFSFHNISCRGSLKNQNIRHISINISIAICAILKQQQKAVFPIT